MPTFNRTDICEAYLAVENNWNQGGWLHERPSNQRRMKSTDVQLHRMKFTPRAGETEFRGYESLTPNGRQIYWLLVKRYGFEMDATAKLLAGIDAFTTAYLVAALWSSTDESDESGGEPLDKNYETTDIAPEALEQMIADCKSFQEANATLLADAGDDEQNGHDFWLTRNRHGAGFWDRGYDDEVGDGLTEAAHAEGECNLYVGDDGKLYVM